jgi:hypothetical protein
MLYVGTSPDKLQELPVAKLCDLTAQNCEIAISKLPSSVASGS